MNAHAKIDDHTVAMMKKMDRALREGGGTHTMDDLLVEIRNGSKQSFAYGSTWAITQVLDFPRKRVLELFMVVGVGCELAILEEDIVNYAKSVGADFIRTQGRRGWKNKAKEMGWKHTHNIFVKEI